MSRPPLPDLHAVDRLHGRAQAVLLLTLCLLTGGIRCRSIGTEIEFALPDFFSDIMVEEFTAWVKPWLPDLLGVVRQGEADHRRQAQSAWN